MSMSLTPRWRTASSTELTTAGVEAMVPASPTPLTPNGFVVEGVVVRSVVKCGRSAAAGQQVVDERRRRQRALVVVDRLLVERLGDALGEAAVHLALDDHRVDHLADVVDADVGRIVTAPVSVSTSVAHRCVPCGKEKFSGSNVASESSVGSTPVGQVVRR